MDWESGKQQLTGCIMKYRYLLLALLAGMLILLFPQRQAAPETVTVREEDRVDLQTQLARILREIDGVGKVEVLLTELLGTDTIFQMDENRNQSERDTVIITNSQRAEQGLVKQIISPVYRGAVVVCQGADSAVVRLSVVDAVKSVTGLSADCITVLRMK